MTALRRAVSDWTQSSGYGVLGAETDADGSDAQENEGADEGEAGE